jgi:hypothetical protein
MLADNVTDPLDGSMLTDETTRHSVSPADPASCGPSWLVAGTIWTSGSGALAKYAT